MAKHGIIVVHGQGEQKRDATLIDVAEPLAAILQRFAEGHYVRVTVERDAPGVRGLLVALSFEHNGTDEEIEMREAWWAKRLFTPSYSLVFGWVLRVWWRQVVVILTGMAARPLSPPTHPAAHPPKANPQAPGVDARIYRGEEPKGAAAVYDALADVVVFLCFSLGAPILLLFLLLAWALQALPFKKPAEAAWKALEFFAVAYMGDSYMYLTTAVTQAAIRDAIKEVIRDVATTPVGTSNRYTSVTILADSLGSIATLDTLLHLAEDKTRTFVDTTFFVTASGLNTSWAFREQTPLAQGGSLRARMADAAGSQRLKQVRLVNVWARYDPLPGGPLEPELREQLKAIFKEVYDCPVINQDNTVTDHTNYFGNIVEVQSRLAYEALGHTESWSTVIAQYLADNRDKRRTSVGVLGVMRGALVLALATLGLLWVRLGAAAGQPKYLASLEPWFRADWPLILGIGIIGVAGFAFLTIATLFLTRSRLKGTSGQAWTDGWRIGFGQLVSAAVVAALLGGVYWFAAYAPARWWERSIPGVFVAPLIGVFVLAIIKYPWPLALKAFVGALTAGLAYCCWMFAPPYLTDHTTAAIVVGLLLVGAYMALTNAYLSETIYGAGEDTTIGTTQPTPWTKPPGNIHIVQAE